MPDHLHSSRPGVIAALILIGIGVILLLAQNGIIRVEEIWRFWPVILVVLGVAKLLQQGPFGSFFGILLIGAGTVIQLSLLGVIPLRPEELWPLWIIFAGLWLLWRNLQPHREGSPQCGPWRWRRRVSPNIDNWALFGGGERRISQRDFEGTEILAVFGGYKLDLRKTALKDSSAVIDATAIFGGVEILVPESWNVVVRGVGVFGGYGDESRHPDSAEPAPELVVRGVALFGGVVIKN